MHYYPVDDPTTYTVWGKGKAYNDAVYRTYMDYIQRDEHLKELHHNVENKR